MSRCVKTFDRYCIYIRDIALPNISIFLNSILILFWTCVHLCVYCCVLLDMTALLELATQTFHFTRNNIC